MKFMQIAKMATLAIISALTVGYAFAQAEKPETATPAPAASFYKQVADLNEAVGRAATPQELDAALAAAPAPAVDNIPFSIPVAKAALRVNHPEALNFAIAFYRYGEAGGPHEKAAVELVAAALRNKDGNLARANQFIAQQLTGKDKIVFAKDEIKPPAWFSKIIPAPARQLALAQEQNRLATDNVEVGKSIKGVATALRAVDLDLVRSRAYLEAMSKGETFKIETP